MQVTNAALNTQHVQFMQNRKIEYGIIESTHAHAWVSLSKSAWDGKTCSWLLEILRLIHALASPLASPLSYQGLNNIQLDVDEVWVNITFQAEGFDMSTLDMLPAKQDTASLSIPLLTCHGNFSDLLVTSVLLLGHFFRFWGQAKMLQNL